MGQPRQSAVQTSVAVDVVCVLGVDGSLFRLTVAFPTDYPSSVGRLHQAQKKLFADGYHL